uniref:PAC domain-containing protein n=1 Tax=Tanacetum cinerariifolium TaxID=118510 RepID=A0A699GJB1_TANCI|nr:hypothetical protein [Tanacetum cinerariifolium]
MGGCDPPGAGRTATAAAQLRDRPAAAGPAGGSARPRRVPAARQPHAAAHGAAARNGFVRFLCRPACARFFCSAGLQHQAPGHRVRHAGHCRQRGRDAGRGLHAELDHHGAGRERCAANGGIGERTAMKRASLLLAWFPALLLLPLAVIHAPAQAQAQVGFGRLFTTPQERQALDARRGKAVAAGGIAPGDAPAPATADAAGTTAGLPPGPPAGMPPRMPSELPGGAGPGMAPAMPPGMPPDTRPDLQHNMADPSQAGVSGATGDAAPPPEQLTMNGVLRTSSGRSTASAWCCSRASATTWPTAASRTSTSRDHAPCPPTVRPPGAPARRRAAAAGGRAGTWRVVAVDRHVQPAQGRAAPAGAHPHRAGRRPRGADRLRACAPAPAAPGPVRRRRSREPAAVRGRRCLHGPAAVDHAGLAAGRRLAQAAALQRVARVCQWRPRRPGRSHQDRAGPQRRRQRVLPRQRGAGQPRRTGQRTSRARLHGARGQRRCAQHRRQLQQRGGLDRHRAAGGRPDDRRPGGAADVAAGTAPRQRNPARDGRGARGAVRLCAAQRLPALPGHLGRRRPRRPQRQHLQQALRLSAVGHAGRAAPRRLGPGFGVLAHACVRQQHGLLFAQHPARHHGGHARHGRPDHSGLRRQRHSRRDPVVRPQRLWRHQRPEHPHPRCRRQQRRRKNQPQRRRPAWLRRKSCRDASPADVAHHCPLHAARSVAQPAAVAADRGRAGRRGLVRLSAGTGLDRKPPIAGGRAGRRAAAGGGVHGRHVRHHQHGARSQRQGPGTAAGAADAARRVPGRQAGWLRRAGRAAGRAVRRAGAGPGAGRSGRAVGSVPAVRMLDRGRLQPAMHADPATGAAGAGSRHGVLRAGARHRHPAADGPGGRSARGPGPAGAGRRRRCAGPAPAAPGPVYPQRLAGVPRRHRRRPGRHRGADAVVRGPDGGGRPVRPVPQAAVTMAAQKSWRAVPRSVLVLLLSALLLQVAWQASRPRAGVPARSQALAPAPPLAALRLAALGEPVAMARLTMLYAQGVDEQAGVSVAWRDLDYAVLTGWLQRVLDLDPRGQSPLLAASQVYGAVSDPVRARRMLDFVHARFADDPNRRWPWLAHAALVARHQLHDLGLARRYARDIRLQATGPGVPSWARQMDIFMLEDMNELDSARALIGALLASGQVTDPRELQFLKNHARAPDAIPTFLPPRRLHAGGNCHRAGHHRLAARRRAQGAKPDRQRPRQKYHPAIDVADVRRQRVPGPLPRPARRRRAGHHPCAGRHGQRQRRRPDRRIPAGAATPGAVRFHHRLVQRHHRLHDQRPGRAPPCSSDGAGPPAPRPPDVVVLGVTPSARDLPPAFDPRADRPAGPGMRAADDHRFRRGGAAVLQPRARHADGRHAQVRAHGGRRHRPRPGAKRGRGPGAGDFAQHRRARPGNAAAAGGRPAGTAIPGIAPPGRPVPQRPPAIVGGVRGRQRAAGGGRARVRGKPGRVCADGAAQERPARQHPARRTDPAAPDHDLVRCRRPPGGAVGRTAPGAGPAGRSGAARAAAGGAGRPAGHHRYRRRSHLPGLQPLAHERRHGGDCHAAGQGAGRTAARGHPHFAGDGPGAAGRLFAGLAGGRTHRAVGAGAGGPGRSAGHRQAVHARTDDLPRGGRRGPRLQRAGDGPQGAPRRPRTAGGRTHAATGKIAGPARNPVRHRARGPELRGQRAAHHPPQRLPDRADGRKSGPPPGPPHCRHDCRPGAAARRAGRLPDRARHRQAADRRRARGPHCRPSGPGAPLDRQLLPAIRPAGPHQRHYRHAGGRDRPEEHGSRAAALAPTAQLGGGAHAGHDLRQARYNQADRAVLASDTNEITEIAEEPIVTRHGQTRYMTTRKVALRDEQGVATHVLGLAIDITERKQPARHGGVLGRRPALPLRQPLFPRVARPHCRPDAGRLDARRAGRRRLRAERAVRQGRAGRRTAGLCGRTAMARRRPALHLGQLHSRRGRVRRSARLFRAGVGRHATERDRAAPAGNQRRTGVRARPRRSGQPRQERISGQYEPRDPHPDERHHRPGAAAAGSPAGAARTHLSRQDPGGHAVAAGPGQRRAGILARGGRAIAARARAVPAAADPRQHEPSAAQPAQQRRQVHHGRRGGAGGARCRQRCRRARRRSRAPRHPGRVQRARHRHRHSGRAPGPHLRHVFAGRQQHQPQVRRGGPGAGDLPPAGRHDGRRSARAQRTGPGRRIPVHLPARMHGRAEAAARAARRGRPGSADCRRQRQRAQRLVGRLRLAGLACGHGGRRRPGAPPAGRWPRRRPPVRVAAARPSAVRRPRPRIAGVAVHAGARGAARRHHAARAADGVRARGGPETGARSRCGARHGADRGGPAAQAGQPAPAARTGARAAGRRRQRHRPRHRAAAVAAARPPGRDAHPAGGRQRDQPGSGAIHPPAHGRDRAPGQQRPAGGRPAGGKRGPVRPGADGRANAGQERLRRHRGDPRRRHHAAHRGNDRERDGRRPPPGDAGRHERPRGQADRRRGPDCHAARAGAARGGTAAGRPGAGLRRWRPGGGRHLRAAGGPARHRPRYGAGAHGRQLRCARCPAQAFRTHPRRHRAGSAGRAGRRPAPAGRPGAAPPARRGRQPGRQRGGAPDGPRGDGAARAPARSGAAGRPRPAGGSAGHGVRRRAQPERRRPSYSNKQHRAERIAPKAGGVTSERIVHELDGPGQEWKNTRGGRRHGERPDPAPSFARRARGAVCLVGRQGARGRTGAAAGPDPAGRRHAGHGWLRRLRGAGRVAAAAGYPGDLRHRPQPAGRRNPGAGSGRGRLHQQAVQRGRGARPGAQPAHHQATGRRHARTEHDRRPDRRGQPPPLQRPPRRRMAPLRAGRHAAVADHDRHRPFQAVQRPLRPPGGRPVPATDQRGHEGLRLAAAGSAGPLRRRGIHPAAAAGRTGRRRSGGPAHPGRSAPAGAAAWGVAHRPQRVDQHGPGHGHAAARTHGRQRPDPQRRRQPIPRQANRARPLLHRGRLKAGARAIQGRLKGD